MSELRVDNIVDMGGSGAPQLRKGASVIGISTITQAVVGNATINAGGIDTATNELTITRGALGTTAAAIKAGTAVNAWSESATTTTIDEGGTYVAGDGTLDINTDKAHISGSSITLKSPDFYLGDTSNYISGSGELSVFCGAIVGSALGFLWFNAPPAKVFMGDTGSLSLGGTIGTLSVITKHEIVLAIIGGLFVLETLSVIIQVISFKLTGKRIFQMAPLHHHFEKKGWPESTIVIRFWIITIVLALIGLATLKIR